MQMRKIQKKIISIIRENFSSLTKINLVLDEENEKTKFTCYILEPQKKENKLN